MNWKLWLGRIRSNTEQKLLKLNSTFIRKNYPYGRNWIFDLKRIIPTARVIIDAGANIGSIASELGNSFPQATIFAFEPVKATFDKLVYHSRNKINIQPFALALGDENTIVEITLQPDNTNNSLVKSTPDHAVLKESVQVVRLDDFISEKDLAVIDILKIDVEGFESEVLQGCQTLLNHGAVKCICLEVGYERMSAKTHFSDIETQMEKNGFQLCGIYDLQRNLYDKRRLWYSNNLYIHKTLLEE